MPLTVPPERRKQLLEAIAAGHTTPGQLFKLIDLTRESIRCYMRYVIKDGDAHVERHASRGTTGGAELHYGLGPAPGPVIRSNVDRILAWVRDHRNATTTQVAHAMGRTPDYIAKQIRDWRRSATMDERGTDWIHISGWDISGNSRTPKYSVGKRKDQPRPGSNQREVQNQRRKRIRATDRDRYELMLAKERTRKQLAKVAKQGPTDPLSLAWMGKLPANNDEQEAA